MIEEWRQVSTCPKYSVSNYGRVRNAISGKILTPCKRSNTSEYLCVNISYGCGNVKKESIHRLVAKEFVPNTDGKEEVNHIDGDKTNNSASNLEWCNMSENQIHAFENGLQTHIGEHDVRSVVCLNDNITFQTIRQASQYYGIKHSAIYACCVRKSNRSRYGKIFRFTERRTE
jgi:hypothetical protein